MFWSNLIYATQKSRYIMKTLSQSNCTTLDRIASTSVVWQGTRSGCHALAYLGRCVRPPLSWEAIELLKAGLVQAGQSHGTIAMHPELN